MNSVNKSEENVFSFKAQDLQMIATVLQDFESKANSAFDIHITKKEGSGIEVHLEQTPVAEKTIEKSKKTIQVYAGLHDLYW